MSAQVRPQINMGDLSGQILRSFSPRERDLIAIIGKCARADRLTRRSRNPRCAWTRTIAVDAEVEAHAFWTKTEAGRKLERVLDLATGDRWSLRLGPKRVEVEQPYLPFDAPFSTAFSVSDGLDSFAGAATWSAAHPRLKAAAINASKQKSVQIERIYQQLPSVALLPFRLRIHAGGSVEDSYRTRVLTFFVPAMLATAKLGIEKLSVLESGQGVLGSCLLTLGHEYPYVSLTPFFLHELSEFVRQHIGADVTFDHPYLWQTKAQVVGEALASGAISGEGIAMTWSCSRSGRKRSKNGGSSRPCGICAGCLHRRCALINAGCYDEEKSEVYVYSNLRTGHIESMRHQDCLAFPCDSIYLKSAVADMRLLAQVRIDRGTDTRYFVGRLARSLRQRDAAVRERLRVLLEQHRQEWAHFLAWTGRKSWLSQHGGLQ